jgi:hypothetical protein
VKFQTIEEDCRVFPGEYLLHKPSQQIVMCGAFKKQQGTIKALANGKLMEDKIENFQKILLSKEERKNPPRRRSCGGCKGR